ncbi:hypothetical protein CDL60_14375 [Roseateles noduli]|nr:hypothetical protein CDL60_14375 [Roseateles noduli]
MEVFMHPIPIPIPIPTPMPRHHRNVAGATNSRRHDRAPWLRQSEVRFTENLLNRPAGQSSKGRLSRPSVLEHNKGQAPRPPKGARAWTPAAVLPVPDRDGPRPLSSSWEEVRDPDVRSPLLPDQPPAASPPPQPCVVGLPHRLADQSPTRFRRIRQRVAEAVPKPLRRAWRAVDAAVRRLIDRLRPQAVPTQAATQVGAEARAQA